MDSKQPYPFRATIGNDETAQLPAAAFSGEIVVVDQERDVRAACRDLEAAGIVGIDTETRPCFRPGTRNRVALLQLSTPSRCYLFRLCRIPLARDLLRLFENPSVLKVGAALHGDLAALHELRHFREEGFVDLQPMMEEWGIEEKSVRKMSAIILGKRVSKAQRLSNWEAATLTAQQQLYAATDAWVCLRIYDTLLRTPKPAKRPRPQAPALPPAPAAAQDAASAAGKPRRRRRPGRPRPKRTESTE